MFCRLKRIERKLDRLREEMVRMAITQEQFDTDLAALVGSIDELIVAVDAAIAAKPPADLTAEDEAVKAAVQKVADEMAKLAPPPEA